MKLIKRLLLVIFLFPNCILGQNEYEIKQRIQESLKEFVFALSYVNDDLEPILPTTIAKEYGSGNYFVFNGREMKFEHFIEDYCYFDLQRHVVNHTLTFPNRIVKRSDNSSDMRWVVSAILKREYATGSKTDIADEDISFTVQWRGMDEPVGLLELRFQSKPRTATKQGSSTGEKTPFTKQREPGKPQGWRHTGETGIHRWGGLYVGELLNGTPHGQGKQTFGSKDSCLSYEGNWENGKMKGLGTMVWRNGDRYEGLFADGELNGQGIFYWPDGDRYEGLWADGEKNGQGTFYFANGDYESGAYVSGKQHGTWIKRNSNGTIIRTQRYDNGVLVRTELYPSKKE